jgi:hypothetical protein
LTSWDTASFTYSMDLVAYKVTPSCAKRILIEICLPHVCWRTLCLRFHELLSHAVEDCDQNFCHSIRRVTRVITYGPARHSILWRCCIWDKHDVKRAENTGYWHSPKSMNWAGFGRKFSWLIEGQKVTGLKEKPRRNFNRNNTSLNLIETAWVLNRSETPPLPQPSWWSKEV